MIKAFVLSSRPAGISASSQYTQTLVELATITAQSHSSKGGVQGLHSLHKSDIDTSCCCCFSIENPPPVVIVAFYLNYTIYYTLLWSDLLPQSVSQY